jgi:hypothetical protein
MQITLTNEEAKTLNELLEALLPDLREEVYKTENFDLCQELKRREALVKSLLGQLASA